MATDKECKKYGIKMAHGQMFHSSQIDEGMNWGLIFLPLVFMTQEQRQEMVDNGGYHMIASMSAATPRSINGMPIFHEARVLTKEESEKVIASYKEEVARMKELEE